MGELSKLIGNEKNLNEPGQTKQTIQFQKGDELKELRLEILRLQEENLALKRAHTRRCFFGQKSQSHEDIRLELPLYDHQLDGTRYNGKLISQCPLCRSCPDLGALPDRTYADRIFTKKDRTSTDLQSDLV